MPVEGVRVELPNTRWARAGDVEEVVSGIGEYLTYNLVEAGPEGEMVKRAFFGEPKSMGGTYPVLVVSHRGGRGSNPTARGIPEEIVYQVKVYHAMFRAGQAQSAVQADGQRRAEFASLEVFQQWFVALEDDIGFRSRVRDWEVSSYEGSPLVDRIGRPLVTEGNVLWRLQADVRISL